MIALPHHLPLVIWKDTRTVPLSPGWLAESIDHTLAHLDCCGWEWTDDVVVSLCAYLRENYAGTSIDHSHLNDLLRHAIVALDYPEVADRVALCAPRVIIHLPDLARRAPLELAFFHALQNRLDEALEYVVRGVKLQGLRTTVKSLQNAPRWRKQCQDLSDEIVLFTRQKLQRWDQPFVDLVIS